MFACFLLEMRKRCLQNQGIILSANSRVREYIITGDFALSRIKTDNYLFPYNSRATKPILSVGFVLNRTEVKKKSFWKGKKFLLVVNKFFKIDLV